MSRCRDAALPNPNISATGSRFSGAAEGIAVLATDKPELSSCSFLAPRDRSGMELIDEIRL